MKCEWHAQFTHLLCRLYDKFYLMLRLFINEIRIEHVSSTSYQIKFFTYKSEMHDTVKMTCRNSRKKFEQKYVRAHDNNIGMHLF